MKIYVGSVRSRHSGIWSSHAVAAESRPKAYDQLKVRGDTEIQFEFEYKLDGDVLGGGFCYGDVVEVKKTGALGYVVAWYQILADPLGSVEFLVVDIDGSLEIYHIEEVNAL